MGSLVFACPNTEHEVSTGIEIDSSSFGSLSNGFTELRCPHCRPHQLLETRAWISEPPEVLRGRRRQVHLPFE